MRFQGKVTKNIFLLSAHTHILFMKVSVLYFMVDLKLTWCNNVPKNEKYSLSFNIFFHFSDEVDQLSYGHYGAVSDDDRLSIMSGGSNTSDGGVTITTWRHLSLAEKQQVHNGRIGRGKQRLEQRNGSSSNCLVVQTIA